MAIRKINSPGVEITERDLSQYTTGPVGTAVLVTGFAAKGRDYEPILLTSRSAWLQQFGEPTNEAERYFFNACIEVINQGGKLYACKLPYKNAALNKFTAKTYTVNVSHLQQLSTVAEYVEKYGLDDILAGDFLRFGISFPSDDERNALFQVEDIKKDIDKFSEAVGNFTVAIPYAYALSDWMGQIDIENSEQDNWMYTPVKFIYEKLSAMFTPGSKFRDELAKGIISGGSGTEAITAVNYVGFDQTASTKENIAKFATYIKEAMGGDDTTIAFKTACDPSTGVNLNQVEKAWPGFKESSIYKFYEANADLFNALNQFSFDQDDEVFGGEKPYVYCDETKFNIGAYYKAISLYDKTVESEEIVANTSVYQIMNLILQLNSCLRNSGISSLSNVFENFLAEMPAPISGDTYIEEDDKRLKEKLIAKAEDDLVSPLVLLKEAFTKLLDNKEFQEFVEKTKAGVYQDTPFAKVAIQYYIDNTVITNPEYKKILRDATNLNIFFRKDFDADGIPTTTDDLSTLFELYNGENSSSPQLSSVKAVIEGAVSEMKYDELLDFSTKFTATDTYTEISTYAFGDKGTESMQESVNALLSDAIVSTLAYSEIKKADPTIKSYLTINSDTDVELVDLETIDGYATGETPVRTNKIVIVDKTRGTLGKAFAKKPDGTQKEVVGIIPVITTAANALYIQALLETGDSGISKYNAIKTATTLNDSLVGDPAAGPIVIEDVDAAIPFASDKADDYTVSQLVAGSFPSIHFDAEGHADRQELKKIGVVVLRAFLDPGEGNKVNYDIVEAYAGELDKTATDPNTGATVFIDTLINSQSEYIEFYSNCFNQTATKELYSKMDLLVVPTQTAGSLGFYDYMTKKNISLTDSITKALPLIWEKNEDINEKQIDIVCDAGVSNIAQFIKSVFNGKAGEYDPASEYATLFKLRSKEDTKTWRAVLDMYDNFCKNIRKDCMFVADGPRPFCLQGNKKIVRPSKPSNTVDGNILPMLKYITGVNTNYGAGYCDWFQKADEFSGDYFWCPPSIQAMGVYLNTDINFNYWSAPAGLNRGIVSALDVAFNPTQRQSDEIYPKCWNYARNYPNDGIVLEGQRTFQTKETALDRVNVRRAMLRFERICYEIARWYVYEDNTTYTRQRFFDALDGVYKEIKGQGGLIDYKIIVDESINTPEVIDRQELRVKIGIKPVKSAEFILCEFNILRQGGSWTEML